MPKAPAVAEVGSAQESTTHPKVSRIDVLDLTIV